MSRLSHYIKQSKRFKVGIILCQFLYLCLCFCLPSQATAMDGPKVRLLMAGLELFPSFLAADQQIQSKRNEDGALQLVIIYNNDKRTADKMASRLQQIGNIKSIPINTTVTQSRSFNELNGKPAGIFISQDNIGNLNSIVQYGKQHSIITFSPFNADLEQGVTGSISVTSRIRPQVNMNTLKSSHLAIKPFFLRISKQYPR